MTSIGPPQPPSAPLPAASTASSTSASSSSNPFDSEDLLPGQVIVGGTTQYELAPQSELRLEIGEKETVRVVLDEGTAEVFGTEIPARKRYTLSNRNLGFFSWHGARISVTGTPSAAYVSSSQRMGPVVNAHHAINKMRTIARDQGLGGPRVLVVGLPDTGKSTLCKTLLSYAVRDGWTPTFVDLDVGQNGLSIPGTLAASPVDTPVGVDDLGQFDRSLPLVFFYGHATPSENFPLLCHLTRRLAAAVDKRFAAQPRARASGLVINTCGWVDDGGYETLLNAVEAFGVDVILVLDNERLAHKLQKEPRAAAAAVCELPKLAGAVTRSIAIRRAARMRAIEVYFKGAKNEFSPGSQTLPFNAVSIFSTDKIQLDSSMLSLADLPDFSAAAPSSSSSSTAAPPSSSSSSSVPAPASDATAPPRLLGVAPSEQLLNRVLAVSFSESSDAMANESVAGFVCVQHVDLESRTLTVLSPTPGPLPGANRLLLGSIGWLVATK